MKLCCSLSRYDSDSRSDGTSSKCQINARASHRLDDDGRMRKQCCKSQAQAIRVGKGISREERIRCIETAD